MVSSSHISVNVYELVTSQKLNLVQSIANVDEGKGAAESKLATAAVAASWAKARRAGNLSFCFRS